jgi:rod shape determining protein RodA
MTIGMMPVTGVPLPFLSYGGSFAITVAVLVGLLINVRTNSQDF